MGDRAGSSPVTRTIVSKLTVSKLQVYSLLFMELTEQRPARKRFVERQFEDALSHGIRQIAAHLKAEDEKMWRGLRGRPDLMKRLWRVKESMVLMQDIHLVILVAFRFAGNDADRFPEVVTLPVEHESRIPRIFDCGTEDRTIKQSVRGERCV